MTATTMRPPHAGHESPAQSPARTWAHGPNHIRGAAGVLVWWDSAWWTWAESGWVLVEAPLSCGQWSEPIDATAELRAYAAGEISAARGQPVSEMLSGRQYLFSEERGAIVVRVCVAETSTVGAPPAPPVPFEVSAHPVGRAGLQRSTDEVAAQIRRDYRKWRVIQWARQAIADAQLPDARGRPNPDNQIQALFAALKRKTTFVKDPHNTECVGSTESILCLDPHGACLKGGDCDEMLVALGATAMAIGIPVRLVVRRYRKQKQAHIVMQYDSAARGDSVWKCIDPSTEDGVCSNAPVEEQFITEVGMSNEAAVFIGIGEPHHDDVSTLGDEPAAPMSGAESQGWITLLGSVQGELDRARARLATNSQAYAQVRSDLGLPQYDTAPSGEAGPQPGTSPLAYYTQTVSTGAPVWTSDAAAQEQKMLSTAAFLSSALADGLAGSRALYFNNGDLFVEAKPGDPYRVLMNPNANGVNVPTYFDNDNNPTGTVGFLPIIIGAVIAVVSLAAAYAVSKYCDYLASSHHDDALSKVSDNQTQLIASGKETPAQAAAQVKALQDLSTASQPPASNTSSSLENIAKWIGVGIVAIAAVAGLFAAARLVEAIPRRGAPASSGPAAAPFLFEPRRLPVRRRVYARARRGRAGRRRMPARQPTRPLGAGELLAMGAVAGAGVGAIAVARAKASGSIGTFSQYLQPITNAATVKLYQYGIAKALEEGGGDYICGPGAGCDASTYGEGDVDGNPQNARFMHVVSLFQTYANQSAPFTKAPPGFPPRLRTDGVLDYATAIALVNS